MLEITYFRDSPEAIIAGLNKRHFPDADRKVAQVQEADRKRRSTQAELDQTKSELKQQSRAIGKLKQAGDEEGFLKAQRDTGALKQKIKDMEQQLQEFENQMQEFLWQLPNLPQDGVPEGRNSEENVVLREEGELPVLATNGSAHWDLIQEYKLINFELGNKVTGAGFPFYTGKGAQLQRALINYFLQEANRAGYWEVQPPFVVNEASGIGTGQLPDKEGQMYHIGQDGLYLIPTAEVPLTNMYRDVILEEKELPVKICGYTPCFRREAGSWGADVRGLNRLHQFDKVELVQIRKPEDSSEALEEMLAHVEHLLRSLELPYRVLNLCAGDLGFTSAFTYDLEVYSGAQKRWLEVSSVSNFETYQANRLKLRYRAKEQKKPVLAHTLNGSALALPRIVAALLENNQEGDGIRLPEVLWPFTGFEKIEKE